MRRTSLRAGVSLAGLLCLLPSFAQAQTDEETAARQHFRLGTAHYENGQFAEAAAEFEEAYRLSRLPRLLYNAYLAYRDLQDLENAARTLRQFLEEDTSIGAAERDQLTARLAAIDAALERMQGASRTDQRSDESQRSDEEDADESTREAEASSPATGGGFRPSPVGFVVGGVGLAIEVAALVTGLLASSDHATLTEQCPNGLCPDRQDLRDAHSRGAALALTTDVLWATGLVAIGTGVALLFAMQERADETPQAAVSCGSEGCYGAIRGRF